jgi:hypothetical protein
MCIKRLNDYKVDQKNYHPQKNKIKSIKKNLFISSAS